MKKTLDRDLGLPYIRFSDRHKCVRILPSRRLF